MTRYLIHKSVSNMTWVAKVDSVEDSVAVDLATSWMHSLVAVEIVDRVHVCAKDKMH
jgi:hypothetical protein